MSRSDDQQIKHFIEERESAVRKMEAVLEKRLVSTNRINELLADRYQNCLKREKDLFEGQRAVEKARENLAEAWKELDRQKLVQQEKEARTAEESGRKMDALRMENRQMRERLEVVHAQNQQLLRENEQLRQEKQVLVGQNTNLLKKLMKT